MKPIAKVNVVKNQVKSKYSYPMIRLPRDYAHIGDKIAYIYQLGSIDNPLFVISFDEHFDVDQFVQLKSKFSLESRVESLEKQLKLLQESISREPETQGGPGEIRTPDLRRVKATS